MSGTSGNDTLFGGANDDVLNGESGDDELYGDDGNDLLQGNNGNDTLQGGSGIDILEGGGGADRFALEDEGGVAAAPADLATARATTSTISDFTQGSDTLDLTDAYPDYASALADASDLGDGSGLYFARVNTTVFGLTLATITQADTSY